MTNRCESGYSGASCLPDKPLPLSLDIQFDDSRKLIHAGWKIIGGSTTSVSDLDSRGCGPMTGSSYLHFDQVCEVSSAVMTSSMRFL